MVDEIVCKLDNTRNRIRIKLGSSWIMEGEIMDVGLSTFEVFEIAEKIERNGAKFYRKAAKLFDDFNIRSLFQELAGWELRHEQIFAAMRKQLSESAYEVEASKSKGDLLIDAQTMAGLAVFGIKPDPSGVFSGKMSKREIIKIALEKEKDSVVYYTGLMDFVPDRIGKDKIDDIIKEEMHHIRILSQSLKQWQNMESKAGM
jgi:rubrerythrin